MMLRVGVVRPDKPDPWPARSGQAPGLSDRLAFGNSDFKSRDAYENFNPSLQHNWCIIYVAVPYFASDPFQLQRKWRGEFLKIAAAARSTLFNVRTRSHSSVTVEIIHYW